MKAADIPDGYIQCKPCNGSGYSNMRDKAGKPKVCKKCKGSKVMPDPKAVIRKRAWANGLLDIDTSSWGSNGPW